ncbi:integrase arm-type DNA-binding domain-containing protein [Novosphingobium sp. SG707]|uniref:tyrosine-type recombinase/integrase n=1 Tax=Novosphingobium sp. SG707 TaxID=2586996 RepID=UPI001445665B|nr:integrase arm-type DNA-binding domain-containing protein [Novosphingobium sp. SG707]NKJ01317.1 integrase [Novosphingobium sp. SG707]
MAQKITFSPAMIDALCEGSLADPLTPGLAIEVLKSGKKRWRYRRQVARRKVVATIFGGLFPAQSMAEAREWARELNLQVEAGIDPRAVQRAEKARNEMTVAKAHGLYMVAVHEGRSSRAKRINKPRTIKDKMDVYNHDIAPTLGNRNIYEVTERDLINLVEAKGKTAKVRANRLAAELKVFFGWTASLRGLEVGLEADPSKRLGDLRFPERARTRKLSHLELEWFLQALVEEERDFQRGLLLCLLSAARITEVARARSDEIVNGVWTIPATRAKNSFEHSIALGPWGRSLMQTNHEWVFQAIKIDGPRNNSVWYKARDRVLARMEKLAGHPIERFTPHDFRRTARSNTKRLKVDFETAEAMLNHVKKGMERTYDLYEMEDEKRLWFLKWEEEVAAIAVRVGVAAALGVPSAQAPVGYSFSVRVANPSTARQPSGCGTVKMQEVGKLPQANAKITFTRVIG